MNKFLTILCLVSYLGYGQEKSSVFFSDNYIHNKSGIYKASHYLNPSQQHAYKKIFNAKRIRWSNNLFTLLKYRLSLSKITFHQNQISEIEHIRCDAEKVDIYVLTNVKNSILYAIKKEDKITILRAENINEDLQKLSSSPTLYFSSKEIFKQIKKKYDRQISVNPEQ